jgi:hypothetical protein
MIERGMTGPVDLTLLVANMVARRVFMPKLIVGVNDLATTHPHLAAEAYGWNPKEYSYGSEQILEWKGKDCSHTWSTSPNARTGPSETNCPYCSNNKILIGFNDFATVFPEIAKQAVGWNPQEFSPKSGVMVNWKCDLGHVFPCTIKNKVNANVKCPVCNGKKVLVGFNDLATTRPDLALEVDGWDATTVTRGCNKKLNWICPKGHQYPAKVNLRDAGRGCPYCNTGGYNYTEKGLFYLIEKDTIQKVGIFNENSDRLDRHRRKGWRTVDVIGPMDGKTCEELETLVLFLLRRKGINMGWKAFRHKFEGFSESWQKVDFCVSSIQELWINI